MHPERHKDLYTILETIVSKAITIWNSTVSLSRIEGDYPSRIEVGYDNYKEKDEPWRESDEDDSDFDYQQETWYENRTIVQPEPPEDFQTPEERMSSGDPVKLRDFGKLQIIVKLANIHLTVDKPNYNGGSWQVEGGGTEREHVCYLNMPVARKASLTKIDSCASAIYYYDSENITESRLSFRQQTHGGDYLPYEQYDWMAVQAIFDIEDNEPSIQNLGSVVCKEGRLIAFPNTLQHKVGSFKLADPTRPGHRRILALSLVDPHQSIISTANIPCQQKEWWEDRVRNVNPLSRLPAEITDHIFKVSRRLSNPETHGRSNFLLEYHTKIILI